jgi:hypothetical protein
MFRKTFIALGLLGVTMLSGCVVYPAHPRYVYTYDYDYGYVREGPAVVVAPVPLVPVFGFYGGYRGGWDHGGRGHWR